jgi:hypothetical protein
MSDQKIVEQRVNRASRGGAAVGTFDARIAATGDFTGALLRQLAGLIWRDGTVKA